MATAEKKIGGKKYHYYDYATTKADAKALKAEAQKIYKSVRVIKGYADRRYARYYIYVR